MLGSAAAPHCQKSFCEAIAKLYICDVFEINICGCTFAQTIVFYSYCNIRLHFKYTFLHLNPLFEGVSELCGIFNVFHNLIGPPYCTCCSWALEVQSGPTIGRINTIQYLGYYSNYSTGGEGLQSIQRKNAKMVAAKWNAYRKWQRSMHVNACMHIHTYRSKGTPPVINCGDFSLSV